MVLWAFTLSLDWWCAREDARGWQEQLFWIWNCVSKNYTNLFNWESFLSFWLSLSVWFWCYVLASDRSDKPGCNPTLTFLWVILFTLPLCWQYVLQITCCCLGKDLSSVVFTVLQVLPGLTSIYICFCRKIFQPLVHGKNPVILKPMIPQNCWLFWLWANILRMVSLVLQTADCSDLDFLPLS